MKQIDDFGLQLCNYQADLFEMSAQLNCSSPFFIKQFSNSKTAKRMDQTGFLFEALDTPACLEELSKEKKLDVGSRKYPSYVLRWIGYLYRYIAYTRERPIKNIFSMIKSEELYNLYEAYHSLDAEEATTRIFEAKNLDPYNQVNALELAKKMLLD